MTKAHQNKWPCDACKEMVNEMMLVPGYDDCNPDQLCIPCYEKHQKEKEEEE